MITDLEPDILECEVNWALESITTKEASGGDGISVELFQILKDDAVKVLHSICQQIWKTQQCPQDWKRSVFIPIPKKFNAKECSNYRIIALISHSSKELPYDPAIPLLGIYTEETRIGRDMCTPMFIATLFIIARTWKQPRCPSADKWIRKQWYIYTMEYYSAIKKNIFESVLMT